MKLITKIKALVTALLAVILAIAVLITCSAVMNSETLDEHFESQTHDDAYENIRIFDCNGNAIYDGGFSSDETLRRATFHLIGDMYGSITTSVLTMVAPSLRNYSILTGYSSDSAEINLTVDSNLQTGAYTLLTNYGYNGCIIVADYKTGEIKAMVSTPSVDVKNVSNVQKGAYLNKALSRYVPGSVFKAVTAAAVLEKNPAAKSFTKYCTGHYNHISCYGGIGHGNETFSLALSDSCNCYISAIAKTYLSPSELSSFVENSGITSDAIVADMVLPKGQVCPEDDLLWTVNGQSKDLLTPMGVASYYCAIANGGLRNTLYYRTDSTVGDPVRIMSSETADFIASSLVPVVEDSDLECSGFAKTGTAELDDQISHSWYAVCLDDADAPAYTVLTFLEHGGSSLNAKALTNEFVNNYILTQEVVQQ